MKRWLCHFTIFAYLSCLGWGIVSHTLGVGTSVHPAMYYVVWDMFCGWSAWSARTHIVAEGESGAYYAVTPTPWGQYHPYGDLPREDYDPWHHHCYTIAQNVLRHTEHEPITRIFVVEELWAKKYNMPEPIWQRHFEEPKERYSYYNLRFAFDTEGTVLTQNANWLNRQHALVMSSNPKLRQDFQKDRSFLVSPSNYTVTEPAPMSTSAPWDFSLRQ